MSDETAAVPPAFQDISAGPTIYFDAVPSFGVFNGAVQIELTARLIHPSFDGKNTHVQFAGAGHLRCSPAAALALKEALDKALQMLLPTDDEPPIGASVN